LGAWIIAVDDAAALPGPAKSINSSVLPARSGDANKTCLWGCSFKRTGGRLHRVVDGSVFSLAISGAGWDLASDLKKTVIAIIRFSSDRSRASKAAIIASTCRSRGKPEISLLSSACSLRQALDAASVPEKVGGVNFAIVSLNVTLRFRWGKQQCFPFTYVINFD
jgi:hypothetical protein